MAQNKINKPLESMPEETRYEIFKRLAPTPLFARLYMAGSLLVLVASTILWSLLGSRVHQGNADQLVNPYMFENHHTLQAALFPSQHTYLLKWPFFFIVHLFGQSTRSYQTMTVIVAVLTVSIFAALLYRIERRPLVFGTLILLVASTLMLVPAQPYAGGLLPVNMAMIANRNLEYVVFIASLIAVIRARRIKSWQFAGGALGLALLMASDKLFLSISIGGALAAFVTYALVSRWSLVTTALRWFMASLAGMLGMLFFLGVISASHLTHIAGKGSGPYSLIHNIHQLGLSIAYAVTGLLTNFGANPAFDTTYFRQIPARSLHNIFNFSGPSLLINLAVFVFAAIIAVRILLLSLGRHRIRDFQQDNRYTLSLLLIWASIATIGAFILTDHYYAGDGRYLTLVFFSLFVALATYIRHRQFVDYKIALGGIVIACAMLLSIPSVIITTHEEQRASNDIDTRNSLIAQALTSHPVNVLVGDYWRVLPIRQISDGTISVTPLSDCSGVRGILSSVAWQPDLQKNSFAYILSLDKSRTDFPRCTIEDAVNAYGKPNASVVIAGKLDNPDELLLFYDHGSHKSAPTANLSATATTTTTPISLEELPNTICAGPTRLNIVAHEDDDLLFMNPDVQNDIRAGNCVRTVYITAGDAGSNQFYWLGREQGSQAAYSKMIGSDTIWIQRTVKLGDNRYVTVSNPKGNTKISLIYLRLPDGNLHGEGFSASHHQSLQKLFQSQIPTIDSVYGESAFTRLELTNALVDLMHIYQPAEIRTQSGNPGSAAFTEHSDHMAAAHFTKLAYDEYETKQYNNTLIIPIRYYTGYPVRESSENVSGKSLEDKTAAFLNYAKHDQSVCHSTDDCAHTPTYGSYLRRQYAQ